MSRPRAIPRSVRNHLLREPLDHLRPEGFELHQVLRSELGIVERVDARKPPEPI